MEINKIYLGDCLEVMKTFSENSIDAIVTDPPYGLSFMGKKWDYDVPSVEIWAECLRVLKPGGYLLSFAGTRTQHRMAVRIEDAGFEIRDMIAWVYGSGFPKSLNIGKAVDKLQGNEREDFGVRTDIHSHGKLHTKEGGYPTTSGRLKDKIKLTKGTSEWEGWGTALKPALEPITVARKPISEKTVAENCLKWGTGGINIDGSRVEAAKGDKFGGGGLNSPVNGFMGKTDNTYKKGTGFRDDTALGRFPANLIHDGSDEVLKGFPNTKSGARSSKHQIGNEKGDMFNHGIYGKYKAKSFTDAPTDEGSASRFFYCAKASKSERNMGCDELENKSIGNKGNGLGRVCEFCSISQLTPEKCLCEIKSWVNPLKNANFHPTIKPIALMEYLVKLVSKPNALVLDPFAGSGSTLIACKKLGRRFIGMELDAEYIKIAEARLKATQVLKEQTKLL